jgi:spore coat polysaccharide biosynthesis predicted glycosyltransferase SpsG
MDVEIVTDGNATYGLGHLHRSRSLARYLQTRGHDVTVSMAWQGDELAPRRPAVTIVDLPYNGDQWTAAAVERGTRVIGLDYEGELAPDLVISIFDRGRSPSTARRLQGLDYAIIREDIRDRAPVSAGDGIVVMIGGADIRNRGLDIAHKLKDQGQQVTLVQGPLSPQQDEPVAGIAILRNPTNLADVMAGCSWAVTNGGSTMMEMMCLGKPVHVIPQTEAEQRLAGLIARQNGVLGVTDECPEVPGLAAMVKVGRAASRLVDGLGVRRICDEVEAFQ